MMKTIYTDNYGFYPWFLLFLSASCFFMAYDNLLGNSRGPFGLDGTTGGLFFVFVGSYWLFLAVKRVRDVRKAKREGRDPTIIRVRETR
jgi:hypothetical protein